MKYFTSFWFDWNGLKSIKLEKGFFLPTPSKFPMQNNPFMQLLLIFHKTNWKSENFKVDLVVSQQLKKLWKEGGCKFTLFFLLFLTVHINFQYKLKYDTFYPNFLFILFYCFTHFFSHMQFHYFFSLIFDYKFNEYEFLHWQGLILCMISLQKRAKTNFKNKQAKTFSIQKVNWVQFML